MSRLVKISVIQSNVGQYLRKVKSRIVWHEVNTSKVEQGRVEQHGIINDRFNRTSTVAVFFLKRQGPSDQYINCNCTFHPCNNASARFIQSKNFMFAGVVHTSWRGQEFFLINFWRGRKFFSPEMQRGRNFSQS